MKQIHIALLAAVGGLGVWYYFDEKGDKTAAPASAEKSGKKDLTEETAKGNTGGTETSKSRAKKSEEKNDEQQDS